MLVAWVDGEPPGPEGRNDCETIDLSPDDEE